MTHQTLNFKGAKFAFCVRCDAKQALKMAIQAPFLYVTPSAHAAHLANDVRNKKSPTKANKAGALMGGAG
jgi:hypothetical protein